MASDDTCPTDCRYDTLTLDQHGPVLRVTLNRPERRNALSPAMTAELLEVVAMVERDEHTSVMVLRGAGAAFCSGYDVTPTGEGDPAPGPIEKVQQIIGDNRLFDRLWRCSVPTIAEVQGSCLAGGTDLALSCDLIVCSTDARIGYPAVRSMGVPATHMWIYHLGIQWTKRLLFTGDSLTGVSAAQLGLVLEAVEPERLERRVLDLATRMAWIPRDLLVANKHVVNHGVELMGRSVLQDFAVRQDVLGRGARGAETFWNTAAEVGVRMAIAERDARFADDDGVT